MPTWGLYNGIFRSIHLSREMSWSITTCSDIGFQASSESMKMYLFTFASRCSCSPILEIESSYKNLHTGYIGISLHGIGYHSGTTLDQAFSWFSISIGFEIGQNIERLKLETQFSLGSVQLKIQMNSTIQPKMWFLSWFTLGWPCSLVNLLSLILLFMLEDNTYQ